MIIIKENAIDKINTLSKEQKEQVKKDLLKTKAQPLYAFSEKDNNEVFVLLSERKDEYGLNSYINHNIYTNNTNGLTDGHYDISDKDAAEKASLYRVLNNYDLRNVFNPDRKKVSLEKTTIFDFSKTNYKTLSDKEKFAVIHAIAENKELVKPFIKGFLEEYPMLKGVEEKPGLDYLETTLEKNPIMADLKNPKIRESIRIMNGVYDDTDFLKKLDESLTNKIMDLEYDTHIHSRNETPKIIVKIYNSKIEQIETKEKELLQKEEQLNKKEAQLNKKEKELEIEKKKNEEFKKTFEQIKKREGDFEQLNNLTNIFYGLNHDQIQNIWKEVHITAEKYRQANVKVEEKSKSNEKQTTTTKSKGRK